MQETTPIAAEAVVELAEVTAPIQQAETPPRSRRFTSLDTLRGLTIVLMLLVNNIALDTATPDHLMHAGWNQGMRLADVVFPWFLFCVGTAIPFSFASFQRRELPAWRYDLKIAGRAVALVALGCLLNSAEQRTPFFSMGVLQLIGMAYLLGAFVYELPKFRRAVIAFGLLSIYGLAILYLPAPGMAAGTFEEGKNLIDSLNKSYLVGYNLDGILAVAPTGALVILASLFGDQMRERDLAAWKRLALIFAGGGVLLGIGIALNTVLPYNKPVWTPSYILVSGGLAALILGVLHAATDFGKWKGWTFPLVVFGSNALLAYVAPILVKLLILQVWVVKTPDGHVPLQQAVLNAMIRWFGRIDGGWAYTALYICFWWAILWLLYRKRVFLKV